MNYSDSWIYVDQSNTSGNEDGSYNNPYTTIQEGIDNASDGDSVVVFEGTYVEKIVIDNKNIYVGSRYIIDKDTSIISKTIISGEDNLAPLVFFYAIDDTTTELQGFTIEHGNSDVEWEPGGIYVLQSNPKLKNLKVIYNRGGLGGGIRIAEEADAVLDNIIVAHNEAWAWGGGLHISGSDPILRNMEVYDNKSEGNWKYDNNGGGLSIGDANPILINMSIHHNSADHGGGIVANVGGNATIRNSIIFMNTSRGNGGGICEAVDCDCKLYNVLIYNNYARGNSGGMQCGGNSASTLHLENSAIIYNEASSYAGGLRIDGSSEVTAINSIIWGNNYANIWFCTWSPQGVLNIDNCLIEGGKEAINYTNDSTYIELNPENGSILNWGFGNLLSDPIFVDPFRSDFHLAAGSPCIDAGSPDVQYLDFDGSRNDIGYYGGPNGVSYEYQPQIMSRYTDSLAIVDLYNATDGEHWNNNSYWLTGNIANWYGITVENDRIIKIDLRDNNLSALTLPDALQDLTALREIYLSNNAISSIPDLKSTLTKLQVLDADSTQIMFSSIVPNLGIPVFTYEQAGNYRDSTSVRDWIIDEVEAIAGYEYPIALITNDNTHADDSYVWKLNGRPVSGADSSTLFVDQLSEKDSGLYQYEVTNPNVPGYTIHRDVGILQFSPMLQCRADTAIKGDDCIFNMTLSKEIADPDTCRLYYRERGENVYQYLDMAASETGWYTTIPGNVIDINGLEGYVFYSNSNRNYTFPTINPASNPSVLPVNIERFTAPDPIEMQKYRMFSAPYRLTHVDPGAAMESALGPYNENVYRMFRWSAGDTAFIELDALVDSLTPGNAFWLITSQETPLTLGAGQTTAPYDSFIIELNPGWNQIGNPYAVPVAWSEIKASGIVEPPVAWADSEYVYNVPVLQPWDGYFVYNTEDQNVALTVPFIKATSLAKSSSISVSYSLNIRASLDMLDMHYKDTETIVGLLAASEEQAVRFRKAPGLDNHLSLCVVGDNTDFSQYFHPIPRNGQDWRFTLKCDLNADKRVRLQLLERGKLPEGWQICLLDSDRRIRIPVENNEAVVSLNKSEHQRHLKLVVGSENFISLKSEGVSLLPLEYALHQNYPNPFNPETTIHYEIPEQTAVQLRIYNMLGQQIVTLVNKEQSPGRYEIRWNGIDKNYQQVPSGMYLTVMQAGTFRAVRKMVVVR